MGINSITVNVLSNTHIEYRLTSFGTQWFSCISWMFISLYGTYQLQLDKSKVFKLPSCLLNRIPELVTMKQYLLESTQINLMLVVQDQTLRKTALENHHLMEANINIFFNYFLMWTQWHSSLKYLRKLRKNHEIANLKN